MIAFKNDRPLLQSGHCVFSDYDGEWLAGLLSEAAERAGTKLPLRHEIAESIIMYLENNCPLHAVPLDFLFNKIRRMLEQIGLPLIAQNLRKQTPPVDIDLDSLAEETPLPLFFYTELRRKMDSLRRLGLNTYHFSGKEACSLALVDRMRPCPTQQRELDELNAFLQAIA